MPTKEEINESNQKFGEKYRDFQWKWEKRLQDAKDRKLMGFKKEVLDEIWDKSKPDLDSRHRSNYTKTTKPIYIDVGELSKLEGKLMDKEMERRSKQKENDKDYFEPESLGLSLSGEHLERRLGENLGLYDARTEEARNSILDEVERDKNKAYRIKEKVLSPFGRAFLNKKIEKAKEYIDQDTNKYPFIIDQYGNCASNIKRDSKDYVEQDRICMDIAMRQARWEGLQGHPAGIGKVPRSKDIDV